MPVDGTRREPALGADRAIAARYGGDPAASSVTRVGVGDAEVFYLSEPFLSRLCIDHYITVSITTEQVCWSTTNNVIRNECQDNSPSAR